MKVIRAVLKKEMLDIFRNRRRMIMIVLFNLVLLPVLAFLPMGLIIQRTITSVVQPLQIPVQGAQYAPELIAYIEKNESIKLIPAGDVQKLVRGRQASAGLIVPPDYEERMQAGESVSLIVVMDKSKSLNMEGDRLITILDKFNKQLVEARLAHSDISPEYLRPIVVTELNTATRVETTGSQLSLLIPGFIITFGLTSGLSVAIGSIAGEKDKQTLEPVLFTSVSRAQLVLGKLAAVLANVIFAALAFVVTILFSSFIFLLVIVFFLRDMSFSVGGSNLSPVTASTPLTVFSASVFPEPLALILFLLSILPIILFGASLQTMISCFARNSEEAYTFSLPLSILSMAPLLASFFLDEFKPSFGHYAIPIFGTILSMRDLLSDHIYAGPLSIMFISSIVYAMTAVGISIWMFNREEVMFRA